jgi:glucan phosphoethanolaminetransferase (alkaline phosphatase superfamily)
MLPFSATYVKIIVVGALVFAAAIYLPVAGFYGAVIRGGIVLTVLAVNRKFIIATVKN